MSGPASRLARLATSRRVLGSGAGRWFWSTAVSAPGLPDRVRARLASRVGTAAAGAGRPGYVAALARAAAAQVSDPVARAAILAAPVTAELAAGRVPADLGEVWAAQLATADELYEAGEHAAAAQVLARALPLGFHRVLHFDRLTSPLADDPAGFLAPVHASRALHAVTARPRRTPAAPRPAGRPLRLLVATRRNDNFLADIRRRYEEHPDVEVRYLDLADDPEREPLTRRTGSMVAFPLGVEPEYGERVAAWLGPHLEWADTVFIDWCVATAVLFTLVDPGSTRVVVRLHSFELFSRWPHLVAFDRVDDLVVVSPHMRELAREVIPALRGPHPPAVHVLPVAAHLDRYRADKPDDARFTLGLVGVGSVAKDPRWALRVLDVLRRDDPRYRLALVGGDIDPALSAATAAYRAGLEADLAGREPGSVLRTGPTGDVPSALRDIGVILSASVRESFHLALIEGAASAAVPVVRDWPFFAGRSGGARTLFPADWVVADPEQAAARIRTVTGSVERWRAAGTAAAAHAMSTWDWSVVAPRMDALLLDG